MAHLIIYRSELFGNDELICSDCLSILLGYDEEICPVCGSLVDMNKEQRISESKFDLLYEQRKKEGSLQCQL